MSTLTTPQPQPDTRPASSPGHDEPASSASSPGMLTPGKKIKAMLSAFDGDSESDGEGDEPVQRGARRGKDKDSGPENRVVREQDTRVNGDMDEDDDGEEEEDVVMPRGRMAARMQTQAQGHHDSGDANAGETAFERVSRMIREEREASKGQDEKGSSEDEDDVPTAGRRRGPAARKEKAGSESPSPAPSPSRARSFSPLFMSSSPAAARQDGSQDDQSDGGNSGEDRPKQKRNPRFQALVARKRKEREEKENAEAEKKKAARARQMEQFSSEVLSGDDGSGEDDAGSGRRFTQQSRPARKASKKAIEEMHRETQRMSRNMQLTHQMQTKKKITKDSLFARFNFMQPGGKGASGPPGSSSAAGSQPSSDAEGQKGAETPQTSPTLGPSDKDTSHAADTQEQQLPEPKTNEDEPEDFPSIEQLVSEQSEQIEEPAAGNTEAQSTENPAPLKPSERKPIRTAPVRVSLSRESVAQHQTEDSDDDLEVVTSPGRCRGIAAFENLPARKAQEPPGMTKLKALAQLTSPTRQSESMNAAELSASLLQRAKQQAAQQRKERMQDLKDKGVIIETAEERAAMEDSVEDLMERARREGLAIAKKEKKASNGGKPEDEDGDADYELSGSDEEAYGDDEDEDEDRGANGEEGGYIENEANESDESEDAQSEDMSGSEAEKTPARRKRPTRVISDDEDDDQEPRTPAKQTSQTVGSAERPQLPELPGSNGLTMSLTQAFAGTLGDNQETQKDGSAIPNSLPDPVQPAGMQKGNSQEIVKDSQEHRAESTDILAGYTQSDARVSESPVPRAASQFSQVPEPTQDAGFVLSPFDPSKRFMGTPTSTIETVLVGQNEPQDESPQKKRPLKRGQAPRLSAIAEDQEGDFEIDASAFDVMKKATKKPPTSFDRKKSKAKEVVEDAAEESDDEYAGLGGGSDDSEGEEDGYDQHMINDNSGEKVDEKELAALNAVHDRATDEKQVAKLLKDINSGALRRRRGADDELDLDDSDDERLARRRKKQREFARMRKALLADEKVGQIAENPKKAAFFKAIEDRDSDDDVGLDFLDEEPAQDAQEPSSQEGQSEIQPKENPPDSETNKRKRPLEPSAEDITNRPPPHLRRKPASAMSKKPANLAEIRETVSFLTETPEYDSFHEAASVDEGADDRVPEEEQPSEHAEEDSEFSRPTHPRRTRGPVIDRLALLRQASSNSANSGSANTRLAFHAGSSSDVGFRPSFARRTTGSSSSSGTSLSTSTTSDNSRRVAKPGASGGGTAKKGSVNFYTAAREREREKELRAKQRSGGSKTAALLNKHASSTLKALGEGRWD